MNEIQSKFINYLVKIYPKSIVEQILDENTLTIREKEAKIEVEEVDHKFKNSLDLKKKITEYGKPCRICDEKGYVMTHQEFPGWSGSLQNKNLIVIGGEISPTKSKGFHIAYELYGKNEISEIMNKRLGNVISDFQKRAYITDIAKCYNENEVTRMDCRKLCINHLLEEITILHEIHKNWVIIFQGDKIYESFKEYNEGFNVKISRVIGKRNHYFFFAGFLRINNFKMPYMVFPHVSPKNNQQWKIIKNNWGEIRKKIIYVLKAIDLPDLDSIIKKEFN